jgi:RHS repeat-associated protein
VVTTYGYNNAGDLTTVDYSDDTPDVAYTFDRRGRRVVAASVSDAVSYSYNDAGQMLTETHTSGVLSGMVVSSSYDALLRRSSLSSGVTVPVAFSYDSASRMSSVSAGTLSASYGYVSGAPGLVSSIIFRTGVVPMMTTTKTYDNLNRLTKIESTTGGRSVSSHTYELNDANQRTKRTDADNSYWEYGYDSLGQVTSAVRRWTNGTVVAGQEYGFAFDDIGNRKTATVNSNVSEYTANLLNQYTQRTVPGFVDIIGSAASSATVTVSVSGVTNSLASRQGEYFRHELALANTNTAAYGLVNIMASMDYNGTNVVVTNTGSAFLPKTPEVFNHDADGSLTNDGRWAYTWDGENRLIGMETLPNLPTNVPVQKLMFQYDQQSRRVSKVVSNFNGSTWSEVSNLRFVYDGWNLLAEVDKTNAVVRSYAWGLDLSGTEQGAGGIGGLLWVNLPQASNAQARGSHFVAFDGNGNVAALLNAQTAQTSAEYEYGPFGETIRATGPAASENVFRFSAKYTDGESGLIYYGFRYYQPTTGRWLSRDPIGELGGLLLYGFVGNNSVSRGDKWGREPVGTISNTGGLSIGSTLPSGASSIVSLNQKLLALYASRMGISIQNIKREYEFEDDGSLVADILTDLDEFYAAYAEKHVTTAAPTVMSTEGWIKVSVTDVNAASVINRSLFASSFHLTLASSSRVVGTGSFEYRLCGKSMGQIGRRHVDVNWVWHDEVDANSWAEAANRGKFNTGWGEAVWSVFEGAVDLVADKILQADYRVRVKFADRRAEEVTVARWKP